MLGKSRGYGFVTFSHVDDAAAAREALNGHRLHDHAVRVDFSITRGPHAPTPGRFMGRDHERRSSYRSDRYGGSDSYRSDRYRSDRDNYDRRDREYDRGDRKRDYRDDDRDYCKSSSKSSRRKDRSYSRSRSRSRSSDGH
ncbi:hypothetical protein HK097_001216 [Rhizophlyctis rosea]|uniref:RRM domain-containing protein n=1 Tax=Rhizophlyctis rosea TaxID=64517 RepID=A0AAD5S755_9FUNG|nr:hypothetical protein HK097_001216 [Rhizophlyctis rosea]